jgi:hypothetical protein
LTPDELRDYRLEMDSSSQSVAAVMRTIDLTPDEFSKIAFVLDFTRNRMSNGNFSPEVEKTIHEGLGDERYAEFKAAYTLENVGFSRFLAAVPTTSEEVAQLRQIRQQNLEGDRLRAAVSQVLGDRRTSQYFMIVESQGLKTARGAVRPPAR